MMLRSTLLALALSAPSPTVSDRDDVAELAAAADEAFQRGDIEAAREALLEALVLEPDNAKLIFGLAQAERFVGNCPRAVELFDRFLATDPEPDQAQAAVDKRAECTDEPPPQPQPSPPPPEATPAPQPAPMAPVPVDTRARPTGPALVGTGSALTIVGAVLVATAFSVAARAPNATTQGDYERQAGAVPGLAAAGWSSLGVGVGLAVTGAVVWGLDPRRRRRRMVWLRGGPPRLATAR